VFFLKIGLSPLCYAQRNIYRDKKFHYIFFAKELEKNDEMGYTIRW
jgi:hypothetical protein